MPGRRPATDSELIADNRELQQRLHGQNQRRFEQRFDDIIKEAAKKNMVALKGYRSVGGVRASIYNAMPLEGCAALVQHMKDFAAKNG